MWIAVVVFVAYLGVVGVRAVRDTLRSLPASNQDWVWY